MASNAEKDPTTPPATSSNGEYTGPQRDDSSNTASRVAIQHLIEVTEHRQDTPLARDAAFSSRSSAFTPINTVTPAPATHNQRPALFQAAATTGHTTSAPPRDTHAETRARDVMGFANILNTTESPGPAQSSSSSSAQASHDDGGSRPANDQGPQPLPSAPAKPGPPINNDNLMHLAVLQKLNNVALYRRVNHSETNDEFMHCTPGYSLHTMVCHRINIDCHSVPGYLERLNTMLSKPLEYLQEDACPLKELSGKKFSTKGYGGRSNEMYAYQSCTSGGRLCIRPIFYRSDKEFALAGFPLTERERESESDNELGYWVKRISV